MGRTLRLICVLSLMPALALAQRPGIGGLGRGKIGTIAARARHRHSEVR